MKKKAKYYWLIIVLAIVFNIFIFKYFSNRLESYAVDYTVNYNIDGSQ